MPNTAESRRRYYHNMTNEQKAAKGAREAARKKLRYQQDPAYREAVKLRNKAMNIKHAAKRKAEAVEKYAKRAAAVFDHYGHMCKCCGETIRQFLTIDHINNDGAEHRKSITSDLYTWLIKNNFPDTFQTLCHNCNTGKHRNGGVCPHTQQVELAV